MRVIEFRGYSKKLNEWIYGNLIDNNKGDFFIIKKGTICEDGNFNSDNNCCDIYEVEKQSVGQYTGLVDINENKIYEGDIIRCVSCSGDFKEIDFVIKFHGNTCSFALYDMDSKEYRQLSIFNDFKVVGDSYTK